MMGDKLFSVWILTYINFNGVFESLDSLFQQDYPEIELIIADDGSPNYDEEIEKVKKYIDEYKGANIVSTKYLHFEKNKGIVCNANNAIQHASGKYLKGLGDGDILCRKDALSKYVDFLENSKSDIVFAKLEGITDKGEKVKYLASCEYDYDKLREMTPSELCNRLYARNCLPAPAWGAKKKLFDENGLYLPITRLIEDYPYWLYLSRNNVSIDFMDEVLVNYRMNGISSAGTYGIGFMEDMFKIYENCIFPYDKRFGVFQPIYNALKKMGLETYYIKARWEKLSTKKKLIAYIKYGIFFLYIYLYDKKIKIKNKNCLS